MIRSTTSILQDREIEEYLGVVVGEAILGANIFKDLFGAVRDVVGGRAGAYEDELAKARDIAFSDAEAAAREMGANAIIGIDLDYEMVKGTMMMVSVTGTAVKVAGDAS